MKQPTLSIIYQGLIDREFDEILKTIIPDIIESEIGVKADWNFQECSVKPPFEREIGWDLSRCFTQDEVELLKEVIETELPDTQLNYIEYEYDSEEI